MRSDYGEIPYFFQTLLFLLFLVFLVKVKDNNYFFFKFLFHFKRFMTIKIEGT